MRVTLTAVEAQLVRLAQEASGLVAARERFFSLVAPVLEARGVREGVFDQDGDSLVLVTEESVRARHCRRCTEVLPDSAVDSLCADCEEWLRRGLTGSV